MIRISDAALALLTFALGFSITGSAQSQSTPENALAPATRSKNPKAADTAQPTEKNKPEADNRGSDKSDADKRETDKRADKIARDNAQRQYKAGLKYGRANLHRQAAQYFEQAIS